MPLITLREYHPSDLAGLMELDLLCFEAGFVFDTASMQHFAEARNAVTVIARSEEDFLAGFAIAHVELVGQSLRGYLVTLDVAPAYRRRGVAGQIMQRIEEQVAAKGAAWMDLHVFVQNAAAVRFYEARGYVLEGTQKRFYGPRLDGYRYRKLLQAST